MQPKSVNQREWTRCSRTSPTTRESRIDGLPKFIGILKTIRVQDEQRLRELEFIVSVGIVGATCTGKPTIADGIRNSDLGLY